MKLRVLILFQLLLIIHAQRYISNENCRTPNQQLGRCLPIRSCGPILDALDNFPKPLSPSAKKYLQSFQCGYDRRRTKVCCPFKPIYYEEYELSTKIHPPDVSRHQNLYLLPRDCGHIDEDDDRIFNGNKTGIFEFPWMALLAYNTRNGPSFRCGGTIITDNYILTAAHCVSNLKFNLIGVRVGEHDVRTQIDCESGVYDFNEICAPPYQELRIENVIPHPGYSSTTMMNDIALVRVSPIDLSLENTRPVCLPLAEARNYNFTSRSTIITGWGTTEYGRPSPELLKVELAAVDLKECKKLYNGIISLDERQLCAGGKSNGDSCNGDSGGPLHVMGFLHGQRRLIEQGVVSFGPKNCGNTPLPGVYTRVAYFMDWILDNIEP